jgi:hypothetical protein
MDHSYSRWTTEWGPVTRWRDRVAQMDLILAEDP